MTSNEIASLIANVGFPIVCTGGMGFILYKFSVLFYQLSITLKGIESRLDNIENVVLEGKK